MTNSELIAALSLLPGDLPVCVTTDASRETLEAGHVEVQFYSDEEGGDLIVIHGVEDMVGIFGEPRSLVERLDEDHRAQQSSDLIGCPADAKALDR